VKSFFTLSFFLSYLLSSGQSFIGQVIDSETQQPVPFATILMTETDNGVIADSEGHFFIENFPRSILKIQISSVGYETYVEHIDLSTTDRMKFSLNPSHFELREVVVSFPVSKLNDENIVEVEAKRFSEFVGVENVSLATALSSVPGVDQVTTGSGIGKPVIRGLSGNRIVVYTQGIRLENQQFGDEHGLGENAIGINRVEVIKGPASLLYGADALGGVLYLVPENYAAVNSTEGFVSSQYLSNARTINTGGGLKINQNGLKFNVFGAYNNSADYQLPSENRVTNTRFDEASFKSSLGYNKKNWVGNLRYGYLGNNFGIPVGEISVSTSRNKMLPFQHVTQHNVSMENVFFIGSRELSVILGYGVNNREEFEDSDDTAALDMSLSTWTLNVKSIRSLKKFNLISGIQGMRRKNVNAGEEELIPDATTVDLGIYSVLNTELEGKLQFQGGARFDFRSNSAILDEIPGIRTITADRQFSSVNISMGSIYSANRLTYRFNVATGFRPPNTAELYSDGEHEGTLRYEVGDPSLVNEKAVQTDFNIEFENEHLTIGVNPFLNKINDYIFLSPTGATFEESNVYKYEQTNATLYGAEVGIHFHPHAIHWLHLESNLSSVFAEDAQGNVLPLIPANKLNTKFSAEFSKKTEYSGQFYLEHTYRRSQNRFSSFESFTPGYDLFNMGISIKTKSVEIEFGSNNLFNVNYIDHLSRLKSDGIQNPGRNIFVGLRYNF
jgi:iron complex outermembrane recepter protein